MSFVIRTMLTKLIVFLAYLAASSAKDGPCQSIIDGKGWKFAFEMGALAADTKTQDCLHAIVSVAAGVAGAFTRGSVLGVKSHHTWEITEDQQVLLTGGSAGDDEDDGGPSGADIQELFNDSNCSNVVEDGALCQHPCCQAFLSTIQRAAIKQCISRKDSKLAYDYLLCQTYHLCDGAKMPGIPTLTFLDFNSRSTALAKAQTLLQSRTPFFADGRVPVPFAGLTAFASAFFGAAVMYVMLRCHKVGRDTYISLEG